MSQCIFCGQKGMLVSVDARGLCKTCQANVQATIDKHLEAIRFANEQMHRQGIDIVTQIQDCDRIIDALEHLHQLEEKGVKGIMQKPIPEMTQQAITTRRQLVDQAVKQFYAQSMAAAKNAQSLDARVQAADAAIAGFQRMIDSIGYSPLMAQAQDEFRRIAYQAEYQRHLAKAETAEKCSFLEDAYEEYQQALAFLKRLEADPNNPSQTLVHLENKIETVMVMVENAKPRRDY